MEKHIIKLLVILLIITFVGLVLTYSKVSNIDNNINRFCSIGQTDSYFDFLK